MTVILTLREDGTTYIGYDSRYLIGQRIADCSLRKVYPFYKNYKNTGTNHDN